MLRLLPGKRWIMRGDWQGHTVVIKLFWQRAYANRQVSYEKRGYQWLQKAGFLTPKILYAGQGVYLPERKTCWVVITSYLVDTESLAPDIALTKPSLWLDLIRLMAKLHQVGLYQTDLHLKNFLLVKQQFYLIDTATLRKQGNDLAHKISIKNLSLLLAQAPIQASGQWCVWYEIYAKARNWQVKAMDVKRLEYEILAWNRIRTRRYQNKVERNSSEFVRINENGYLMFYNRTLAKPDLLVALKDLNNLFKHAEVLKAGNTCTVIRAHIANQDVIVKRYNDKGIWYGLKRLGRKSRARNCWRNAHILQLLGIATAKPIAMLELKRGLRRKAYFISEYISGIRLDQGLTHLDPVIMQRVADLLNALAKAKIGHGDMKASNILLAKDKVYLIDLDAMRVYHKGFAKVLKRDRQRFLKNWQANPNIIQQFERLLESTC